MNDNNSITINKKTDLEKFNFSEFQAPAIDALADQISIVQFWRVLQKRRWLVLGSLVAVVLMVAIISVLLPKRYDASSRILLDLEGTDGLGLEQVVMPIGLDLNTKLETQIHIVQSDTIANSVIKQLELQRSKEFAAKVKAKPVPAFDSLGLEDRAMMGKLFHKALNVQLIPKRKSSKFTSAAKIPNLRPRS
jgi:uncharacterized protein involved in exopolysaccharide biosynthesis